MSIYICESCGHHWDLHRTGSCSTCEMAHALCILGPFRFQGWHAQFEFKAQDLWIGAYWKRAGNCVDLWLCLIPCFPLHLSWWWSREPRWDAEGKP